MLACPSVFGDNGAMSDNYDFPLNKLLAPRDRELIRDKLVISEAPSGTVIFDATSCKGILAVIRGVIRVYILSETGREITLYRLFENDICTLSISCLMGKLPMQAMIKADTDCTIASLSNDVFSGIHERTPAVQTYLLEKMNERLADVMWVVEQVAFHGMDRRIGRFLLEQPSTVVYATHEEIAFELGTAREVVSRMLKYFEKNGYITLSRGKLKVIDPKGLTKSIGGLEGGGRGQAN